MEVPKTFLLADTHFGHLNMIGYCHRPPDFEDLIMKSLKIVKPGDTLIHLGDVAFHNEKRWNTVFCNAVAGRKILVRGNHDRRSDDWYKRCGWDTVVREYRTGSAECKGDIVCTHRPVPLDKHAAFNCHGHLHDKPFTMEKREHPMEGTEDPEYAKFYDFDRHKLVSLELMGYKPHLLEDILK